MAKRRAIRARRGRDGCPGAGVRRFGVHAVILIGGTGRFLAEQNPPTSSAEILVGTFLGKERAALVGISGNQRVADGLGTRRTKHKCLLLGRDGGRRTRRHISCYDGGRFRQQIVGTRHGYPPTSRSRRCWGVGRETRRPRKPCRERDPVLGVADVGDAAGRAPLGQEADDDATSC